MGAAFHISIVTMWRLGLIFLLSFAQLISCRDYYALRKDECLRQIYICANYRFRVTASDGLLETKPRVFEGICRKHKKYIACVDDAVRKHCTESMSDLAQFTLNNRISLKLFCTDPEWKKSYYASASCINENKEQMLKICAYEEENMHVDNSRLLHDLPEPCDALQRVFNCAVQKMKEVCGETAAEVFRRMKILNEHNLDVTCEFRRRNPMQCQYDPQKKHFVAVPKDPVAPSCNLYKQPDTEAMHYGVREVIVNTVKNLQKLMQQGFKVINSDDVKLQKLNAIEDEESSNCEEDGSKLCKRLDLQKDFNIYSHIAKIKHLKKSAELELNLRIKNYLFRFVDVLRHEEINIGSISEEIFEIYWTNLELPVRSIVCEMINIASKNVFKCSIKWDLDENELHAHSSSNWENQNSESVSNGHLSDIHMDGYLVKEELLNKSSLDEDCEDSYREVHGKVLEDPSSKFVSGESSDPAEFSKESYSESMVFILLEPDSVSQNLKTSFMEDKTEIFQLREIEDAIDEKLQIIDANMESNIEENHCPTDKPAEDYGIRYSVFIDPDMDSKENTSIAEAAEKEKLLTKSLLKAVRGKTETITEEPFYELIERFLYEDNEKLAREKELEYFINEMEKIRARDREAARLAHELGSSHEERLLTRDVELSIEEREEILAREIKEREKNREKNLEREIEEKVKEMNERRARKKEMERIMDDEDDELERERKQREIKEFLRLKEETLARERAKAGSKPTLVLEEL